MKVDTRTAGPDASPDAVSVRAGTVTLVLGALFLAATVFTYALSLSDQVNPPHWVRVLGLVWLPAGLFGTPVAYAFARSGAGRTRGRAGLAVAIVALVAFVVLMFAAG